ncbi:MAG: PPC domain-containing DNA-binding protein [Chlamydiales bacterium]
MKTYVIRLTPGQDLKLELGKFIEKENIQAGVILAVVGSLRRANLRFAGKQEGSFFEEDLEIVSCTGTLCKTGMHIHMAISNPQGETFGGHVLDGCMVRTTAEIVIGGLSDYIFSREMDKETGYKELSIKCLLDPES